MDVKFSAERLVSTTLDPVEAHLGQLDHLTNQTIAKKILRERHGMTKSLIQQILPRFTSHVKQGLLFYYQSVRSSRQTQPVLQYYSWLNFAVACILAYRPPNHEHYKKHGIEDLTHSIESLDKNSHVLRIRSKGALPLFHSILSDEIISNQKFRLGEIASAIHMISHEINLVFDLKAQKISVEPDLVSISNEFHSRFIFKCYNHDGSQGSITKKRLERAIPLLAQEYKIIGDPKSLLQYSSRRVMPNQASAKKYHEKNLLKMINFGGHQLVENRQFQPSQLELKFVWPSSPRKPHPKAATPLLSFQSDALFS